LKFNLFVVLFSMLVFIACSERTENVYTIELDHDSLTIKIDSSFQLLATGKDDKGGVINGLSFLWQSTNQDVAIVSDGGVITGVSEGRVEIFASIDHVQSAPSVVSVVENNTGFLTDIDNNTYKTIKIGDQVWMAENLRVTHYRNGVSIPHRKSTYMWLIVGDPNGPPAMNPGGYCYYSGDSINVETFGLLYNWHAASGSYEIAPDGWHIPSPEEWNQLETALGMSEVEAPPHGWPGADGSAMLAGGPELWWPGVLTSNPGFGLSGFNAVPGGFRSGTSASFDYAGRITKFWSSHLQPSMNHATTRSLNFDSNTLLHDAHYIRDGYSIRCVRDY